MGYNLELRTTQVGGELNIFDSGQVRWITGGVTIDHETVPLVDGKRILPAGTIIGRITGSKKFGPWNAEATDGREVPLYMIAEEVDVTIGDKVVTAFDHARVIVERLPYEKIPVDVVEALRDIIFVKDGIPFAGDVVDDGGDTGGGTGGDTGGGTGGGEGAN